MCKKILVVSLICVFVLSFAFVSFAEDEDNDVAFGDIPVTDSSSVTDSLSVTDPSSVTDSSSVMDSSSSSFSFLSASYVPFIGLFSYFFDFMYCTFGLYWVLGIVVALAFVTVLIIHRFVRSNKK